jgi:hypothetical protein
MTLKHHDRRGGAFGADRAARTTTGTRYFHSFSDF